ncbi:MAG: methylenetetrahydrofolate reductase [Acidimicrobiales bacterium]
MSTDRTGALVRDADLEVIPLKALLGQLPVIPTGTRVAITCSPKFGLERTLEHARAVTEAGYRCVPHVAARQVHDETELRAIVDRLRDLGVADLYVIGGDVQEPAGDFGGSAELLEALSGLDHGFERVGVACYPEGHPTIPDQVLWSDLLRKQPMARYMVSQVCFEASTILSWLGAARQRGVTLPLRISVAGPLRITKLLELSVRMGVGPSLAYLRKQHGLVGTVLRGGAYRPEELVEEVVREGGGEDLGIEGLHISTFNQLDAAVSWQQRMGAPPG